MALSLKPSWFCDHSPGRGKVFTGNFFVGGLIGKEAAISGGNSLSIQIWGLYYFLFPNANLGTTVSVEILGQDCGDFTISATDGSVIVPLLGTTVAGVAGVVALADILAADGVYNVEQSTPLQLTSGGATFFVKVPVVIGNAIVSQGQKLRPQTATDLRSNTGDALGKTRRAHMYSMLVQDAVNISIGTSLAAADLVATPLFAGGTDPATGALPAFTGYSGVIWDTLVDNYSFDSMFAWQVDRPTPLVVSAAGTFLEGQER